MELKPPSIFKVKGSKAWWKYIFPITCFALSIYILLNGMKTLATRPDIPFFAVVIGWTSLALIVAIPGIVFSMVEDYYFDSKRGLYKHVKRVGLIGFGYWRPFEKLDYISVFQNVDGNFSINLWYDKNKHFDLKDFYFKKDALDYATKIANSLGLEMHNALDNQGKYINEEAPNKINESDRRIDAYFSQGKLPFWRKIIAAIILTAGLGVIYYFILGIDVENKRMEIHPYILQIPFILISIGLSLSIVNDYVFDIENEEFRIIHNIGPIRWGKWKRLRSLDYISVYQKRPDQFQINLWYNTNKHITFYVLAEYDDALKTGKILAKELDINLLDASDPHDTKWVDI